jgi:hypothetical protein
MRKLGVLMASVGVAVIGWAGPAAACGGLVAPNGTVRLLRTSTLAAYHDGVEHYVTSFTFAGGGPGGGGEFGSIVPLPGVPTKVERGGDWTLQRLERETTPRAAATAGLANGTFAAASVQVLQQVRIDALDLTVLSGGGAAVGDWAKAHGFLLTPDAPQVLDFYAARSPVFLAARFDAAAARGRGQLVGDGTPIHLTIPTPNPWVPLRILALGRGALEPVQADVYLLDDREPALLPAPDNGMRVAVSEPASAPLLNDLRNDKGMSWVPNSGWLTLLRIDSPAGQLTHDLAIDASGAARPSVIQAGLTIDRAADVGVPGLQPVAGRHHGAWYGWALAALAFGLALVAIVFVAFRPRPAE